MVAARKIINLEDKPDLVEVARSVSKDGSSVSLRESGQEIAVIAPPTGERKTSIMDFAGALHGVMDADRMREIYESRGISNRNPFGS